MPMTVEIRNGVQSSTISYSNMVIPEEITKKIFAYYSTFFENMKPENIICIRLYMVKIIL